MDSPKYPRTLHLPWSPGATSDDKRMTAAEARAAFPVDTPIVITEKMDGSNVCLEHDAVYARSHSAPPDHPSFDELKALHATLRGRLPQGLQVFGEWLFARHSIAYDLLPGYLMVFGIRELGALNRWLSWSDTVLWADELGLPTAPLVGIAPRPNSVLRLKPLTEHLAAWPSDCGSPQREGIVVRHADGFSDEAFSTSVAKWVRKNHVQTDEHWKHQAIVKNGLRCFKTRREVGDRCVREQNHEDRDDDGCFFHD